MLGKILLTLAVIVAAFLFLRQRGIKEKSPPSQTSTTNTAVASSSADLRLGAYMFLVLIVGLGIALYYFQWRDDHSILTIRLHSDKQSEAIEYQVYKYQLQERSFTTLDGVLVTVASSERMEVEGL